MNKDHVFIDVAVTHPNPRIGQVIAIAAVRTDRKGMLLASYSDRIIPTSELSDEEIDHCPNGYIFSKEGFSFQQVAKALIKSILEPFDKSYYVIAVDAATDKEFLKEGWKKNGCKQPAKLLTNRWLDVLQVSWPLVHSDMIPDASFDSLCTHFQIVNPAPDTATGDCEALVKVYWAMMNRFRAALTGEEVIRQAGGKPLAIIRNIVGF